MVRLPLATSWSAHTVSSSSARVTTRCAVRARYDSSSSSRKVRRAERPSTVTVRPAGSMTTRGTGERVASRSRNAAMSWTGDDVAVVGSARASAVYVSALGSQSRASSPRASASSTSCACGCSPGAASTPT